MRERLIFCEDCKKDVYYTNVDVVMESRLKGAIYEYAGKKTVCSECGSEVYVSDVEDSNLKSLYDAYRQKNGIIALERILEIPAKYNIGKRPLSLILGWGEMTFSRYCDGDMPTKQYSEVLQRIYDDSDFYLTLLEENKESLTSMTAYKKSKSKTKDLLGRKDLELTKIDDIIDYLLYKCEDITPLALQKSLYYVQGFYYAFMGEFIFSEDCEAWVHGPAYRDIYSRYSSYKFDIIDSKGECDDSVFTISEKTIIDNVIKNLCCYSGKILEKFTHSESPWLNTRGDLPKSATSNRTIQKQLLGDYFLAVKKKYEMLDPSDIEIYGKKMFEKNN